MPRFVSDQTLTAAGGKKTGLRLSPGIALEKRNCFAFHPAMLFISTRLQLNSNSRQNILVNYYNRHHHRLGYVSSPNWSNVKANRMTSQTKTCVQIYMHSMSHGSLLARPSAHAETLCYKSVWMSAAKLPLGAFWLQLCPPGTHYVAKFYDCWFHRQNGREGEKNEFNYSDTIKQQSHCGSFFIYLFF